MSVKSIANNEEISVGHYMYVLHDSCIFVTKDANIVFEHY